MRGAYEKAKQIDAGLTAYDFEWGARVYIKHEDGTELDFNYAFVRKEDEWVFIFTEHHGFHVYHMEDLEKCVSYKDEENDQGWTES